MDWILAVILHITVFSTLNQIQCVRINPFNGFSSSNYDPVADFSINQGTYLPNMPMASIYPMMNDDSFNTMVGLQSLKPQMVPFVNPLSPTVPQVSIPRPATQNKAKNNQRNPTGNPQQRPQKNRGVSLDVRGGGYKVDKQQNAKPYKAPIAESSVRNSQKYSNGRNTERNPPNGRPGRPGNAPNRNRKPNQRPRGPTMKNPHYNMKFETSLPSMPPNVEFVSPDNVLPLHPRIYKQFLQQNKQFGSYFQNLNKQNPFKKQNGPNYGASFQGNSYNPSKPSASKSTRNRVNPHSSSLAQLSQFSNFAPNFQVPGGQMPSPDLSSQHGFFQQQNVGKLLNSQFDTDIFNQDPSFYASLSQTPEGRAVLSQLQQQQQQMGNLNKPPKSKSQRTPFTNKPPQQAFPNSNPKSYASSSLPSHQGGVGSQSESVVGPSYMTNYFGTNQGIGQYDAGNANANQSPSSSNDYQQMMMYYQQQMQQHVTPPQQYPSSTVPTVQPPYRDPPPRSNYPPTQQFANPQSQNNPYNEYQYMQGQGSSYQDSQSQAPGNIPQAASYGKTKTAPYEEGSYPNPSLASYNQDLKSQISEIQAADQAGYTLPPYSPIDPLSTFENNNPDMQDYYGYEQAPTHHNSPIYSNDQNVASYTHGGLHEISPYSEEKNSADYPVPVQGSDPKSPAVDPAPGYMTPEQLFAPQSTGLQSEAKFGYPSAHGGISQSQSSSLLNQESSESHPSRPSYDEQHEGSDRAALHLPKDVSIYVARQPESPQLYEHTETYDPFSFEANDKKTENDSTKQLEVTDISSLTEAESDEKLHEAIQEFQKLLTKAPKNSYMVEPTDPTPTTTRIPVLKKASSELEEMKNHKTTPSYMFQYAPAEKTATKASPTWQAWKPNASRYHLPLPETKPQTTTTAAPTTITIPTTTTTTTPRPSPTPAATPSTVMTYYHEPETPICARHNNLTYCLQDPEYPKDMIKKAIEKNRHPLDHFLVDISTSSNIVDDSLNKVFENSVPLQSTAISYSFEGKAISPSQGVTGNSTGCTSNVYYAKPLRAINTSGLWKTIVNVEFEETGANYTQTVRIEECSHTPGYVATCGTETISACLQQYKLYRLLAWESHRGFYIDAFLLPISCFCGSQQSFR